MNNFDLLTNDEQEEYFAQLAYTFEDFFPTLNTDDFQVIRTYLQTAMAKRKQDEGPQ